MNYLHVAPPSSDLKTLSPLSITPDKVSIEPFQIRPTTYQQRFLELQFLSPRRSSRTLPRLIQGLLVYTRFRWTGNTFLSNVSERIRVSPMIYTCPCKRADFCPGRSIIRTLPESIISGSEEQNVVLVWIDDKSLSIVNDYKCTQC